MDNVEELQDHEILMELLQEKRDRDNQKRVQTIIMWVIIAAFAIACAIAIPKMITAYRQYNEAMKMIKTVYGQFEEIVANNKGNLEKIAEIDFDSLVKSINDITSFISNIFGGSGIIGA